MPEIDPPIVIEARDGARACVIWLHGLGADGHDFEPVVAELDDAVTGAVRFVFPHAPHRPVTVNGGMRMRAWYDIVSVDIAERADEAGVRESARILETLIAEQKRSGLTADRIVLAGFSQGGAIALHAGLRHAERLAGVLALSTYLPLPDPTLDESSPANADVPIFMAHGSQDPVIPLGTSDASSRLLADLGYPVEVHTYPMPHSVCGEELRDIGFWLKRVLPD